MTYFDTGLYNVQSTLFAWMYAQLIAFKPASIDAVRFQIEWPEEAITAPLWSMIILSVDSGSGFQGNHVSGNQRGGLRYGISQIDCWVTRRNDNWVQQLAQMQDAVSKAVHTLQAKGSALVIYDFYTNVQAPIKTSYRMTITGLSRHQPPTDPNPDIDRKRMLLNFQWVERI